MNSLFPVISNLQVPVFAGLFFACSMALAGNIAKPVKLKPDAVVYSESSRSSRIISNIDRNSVFYIQLELLDSSGRWCAINDSEDSFIGYAPCGELIPHRKPILKRAASGNGANSSKAKKNNEAAAPKGKSSTDDDGYSTTSRIFVSILFVSAVILLTIILFLSTLLSAYIIYRYRKTRKEDIDHKNELSDYIYTKDDNLPAASEETEDDNYHHITKAPPAGVGNLVKCQLCGVIQILGYDSKCINCRAMITYCIKVEQTQTCSPENPDKVQASGQELESR